MSFNLISYPLIVQKQATAPTITSASLLWRDTDDDVLYFSDGASWKAFSSASDSAGFESMIANITIEILRLSAEGSLTAPDYDNMFVDFMGLVAGQDGTIDTVNTDAIYSGSASDAHGDTLASSGGLTGKRGFKIHTNEALTLNSVTKHASTGPTKCLLTDASHTLIEEVDFVGDVATFASRALTTGTDYYIKCHKVAASWTEYYQASASYPYNATNLNYTGGVNDDTPQTATASTIVSIDTSSSGDNNYTNDSGGTGSNLVIQTNAQAVEFAPTYCFVHVKDKTLAGTGSITYDISFDGGSTWDSTGNALDAKIAVTDGSSKSMVIILNLNGVGAGNTALLKDYEVVLWSS